MSLTDDMPGLGPGSVPAQLLAFRKNAPCFLWDIAQQYGAIARFQLGARPMVLASAPELVDDVLARRPHAFVKAGMTRAKHLVGEGLLTSEGPHHDRQRGLAEQVLAAPFKSGPDAGGAATTPPSAAPAAHPVEAWSAIVLAQIARTEQGWSDGAVIDIGRAMLGLTARVMATLLMGPLPDAALAAADADLSTELGWLNRYPEQLAWLDGLPLPHNRRLAEARARLTALVDGGIAQAATAADGSALLGALLAARDAEGKPMARAAVRDEALTFFIAGHEPTAMALTWTLHFLSQRPELADAVADELRSAFGRSAAGAALLPGLALTQRVFNESLRHRPPVWIFARQPVAAIELGGYAVPAGTWVFLSAFVTHHLPTVYPDPFGFDPLRWTPEAQAARPPGAFFPFGHGARGCLGERLARLVSGLALAELAQRWRFAPLPDAGPPALEATITLRPKGPLRLQLTRRR